MTLSPNHALVFLLLLISSCSIFDDKDDPVPAVDTTTRVFYADGSRIYSSTITGTHEKIIFDAAGANTPAGSIYSASLSLLPDSGKVIFAETVQNKSYICIMNEDGTNKKDLLLLPAMTNVFFKALKGGRIYYALSFQQSSTVENWTMNSDGTGNRKLSFPPNSWPFGDASMAIDGSGFLTGSVLGNPAGNTVRAVYFQPLVNWVADPAKRWLVTTLTYPFTYSPPGPPILSADGTKMACLSRLANGDFEVLVRDLNNPNGTAETIYTYKYPTSGPGALPKPHIPSLFWVSGTDKLMITYGNFEPAGGPPPEYMYCFVVDLVSGKSADWKIQAGGVLRMTVK